MSLWVPVLLVLPTGINVEDLSSSVSSIVEHYEACLTRGLDSGQRVGWRDSDSQVIRFEIFDLLMSGSRFESVCDFGCGAGDFLTFLRQSGFQGTYVGVDASKEMVNRACLSHQGDNGAQFYVDLTPVNADFVVASGVFNVRLRQKSSDWTAYMRRTVSDMWTKCKVGIVFNVLSTVSDPGRRRDDLFYLEPTELIQMGLELSPDVRFAHHYGLFDSTIAVLKTHEVLIGAAEI